MMKNIQNILLIGLIVGIILISGCAQEAGTAEKGFLEGMVGIGPLCPGPEREVPEPECQPTEETYKNSPVGIWDENKRTKIGDIAPNEDGTYKLELPAGDYVVELEKPSRGIGFSKNLPASVTIRPNETTRLDIFIDTGIR